MERNKRQQPPNPRETANLFSALTFYWTLKIFIKGYKSSLTLDDVYETLKKDKSDFIGDNLERHFLKDVARCNSVRKERGISDPKKGPQPSLGRALLKTFWVEFTILGVLSIFNEIFVRLWNTILLGRLLEYFRPDSIMERKEALVTAGAMVVLTTVSCYAMNHYMMGAFHLGMRARIAVCSLIYRKSLRISRNALGESAQSGQVVNLLSNDVNRFDIVSVFLHYTWISPLAFIIIFYFMYSEAGPAALLGVLVIFTVVPIQGYAGKLSAKFRLQTALKTDERVRFMGEIISGVQVIKMYAWEKPFQALITLARRLEIKVIRKNSYVRAIYMTFLLTTTRIAMFFVMFSMVLFGNKLSSAKVFVIATYFHLLASTISSMFVRAIAEVAEAYVALKRLQKYLGNEEFVPLPVKVMDVDLKLNGFGESPRKEDAITGSRAKPNIIIKAVNLEARWLPDKPLTLDLDTLEIPRGKLIGVIGPVGCGKSSLLQALLGELPLLGGSLEVRGSVSYACQEPWVFGASVRQNILFGQPYNKFKYNEVVRVCALKQDFEQFPFGDQTLVGERGTSLSGGQKARINLARAVYRDADIYLLDDPLSAVDAHVGRHLFEQCVVAHLRRRTRILVTHQLHYLKDADHIILLKDGRIELQGTYQEISASSLQYAQLLSPSEPVQEPENRRRNSSVSKMRQIRRYNSISEQRKRGDSTASSIVSYNDVSLDGSDDEVSGPQHKEQYVIAEASSAGKGGRVGIQYLTAGSNILSLIFVISTFVMSQILASAADYWVSFLTAQEELRDYYSQLSNSSTNETDVTLPFLSSSTTSSSFTTDAFFNYTIADDQVSMELLPVDGLLSTDTLIIIYGTIVALALFCTLLRSFSFYNLAMRSSMALHDMMFRGVIRSPMLFFNLNPSGRIINRFAKDMGTMDELLPKALLDSSQVLISLFGVIGLACYVNPYFIVPIAILFLVFFKIRTVYLKTSKNIKRMEGIAKSPVFTHLNATLQGLSTIRAYKAQDLVKAEFDNLQDVHTSTWYIYLATNMAFGAFLDILCTVLIAVVIFSFLLVPNTFMGNEVGLAITQCMTLTVMVQWGIRQSTEVSNQFMAVERVLEYTLLPPEEGIEPDDIDRKSKSAASQKVMATKLRRPPKEWPEYGRIMFKDLSMKYTDKKEDPYVLRNLNCDFLPKEKIGIVGRTGAGKSSLISALFRLAYNTGAVIIDGIDTREISLTDLRKNISIIPQDPVLFSGTLRRNLDPFEEYSDAAVWQALEEVELKEALSGPAGLESKVMDGGSNFSVGQRQLVCLARALLRKNRLLMLDEATANVDPRTDSLIQTTIRSKFAHCTVLTVAHRLNTIMDSDRVLVMDHGTIVELRHPHLLLQNKDGFFSKMVAETGEHNAREMALIAKENYYSKPRLDDIQMIDE